MIEMTRKDEIPEIAKRIRQLRKAKGWTQPKLAKEAKVTDGAVKMWETGKRFPRGANLKNLATISSSACQPKFGLQLHTFLGAERPEAGSLKT